MAFCDLFIKLGLWLLALTVTLAYTIKEAVNSKRLI